MKKFSINTTSESGDHYIYFITHPEKPNKEELKLFLKENACDIEGGVVYENVQMVAEIKKFLKIPIKKQSDRQ